MIGLFAEDGTRLPVTYNGLTLNDPDDDPSDTYELDRVMPHTQYLAISDERPTGDGTEIYESRKLSKAYRLLGRAKASSKTALYDRLETLARTFDPALISFNNAVPNDFLPLDFTTPSAAGDLDCRYYSRPLGTLDRTLGNFEGLAVAFTLDMYMVDPRRYAQTLTTLSGAGTTTPAGDYPSPPTLTLTASGGGSATYSIQNTAASQGAVALVLNLSSLVNGDVVSVDMTSRTILKNGTYDHSLFASGDYFLIEPSANVIAITNGTNISTSLSYRAAWSL